MIDTKPIVSYLAIRLSSYLWEHLPKQPGKHRNSRVSINTLIVHNQGVNFFSGFVSPNQISNSQSPKFTRIANTKNAPVFVSTPVFSQNSVVPKVTRIENTNNAPVFVSTPVFAQNSAAPKVTRTETVNSAPEPVRTSSRTVQASPEQARSQGGSRVSEFGVVGTFPRTQPARSLDGK